MHYSWKTWWSQKINVSQKEKQNVRSLETANILPKIRFEMNLVFGFQTFEFTFFSSQSVDLGDILEPFAKRAICLSFRFNLHKPDIWKKSSILVVPNVLCKQTSEFLLHHDLERGKAKRV